MPVKFNSDIQLSTPLYFSGICVVIPAVVQVIYNNPATIIVWNDGSKTVVKCHDGDEYDKEKGLLLCFAKKLFGNKGKYNDVIREWSED